MWQARAGAWHSQVNFRTMAGTAQHFQRPDHLVHISPEQCLVAPREGEELALPVVPGWYSSLAYAKKLTDTSAAWDAVRAAEAAAAAAPVAEAEDGKETKEGGDGEEGDTSLEAGADEEAVKVQQQVEACRPPSTLAFLGDDVLLAQDGDPTTLAARRVVFSSHNSSDRADDVFLQGDDDDMAVMGRRTAAALAGQDGGRTSAWSHAGLSSNLQSVLAARRAAAAQHSAPPGPSRMPDGKWMSSLGIVLPADARAPHNERDLFAHCDEDLQERPWRNQGADLSDYFNYGLTESTWRKYCSQQAILRAEIEAIQREQGGRRR